MADTVNKYGVEGVQTGNQWTNSAFAGNPSDTYKYVKAGGNQEVGTVTAPNPAVAMATAPGIDITSGVQGPIDVNSLKGTATPMKVSTPAPSTTASSVIGVAGDIAQQQQQMSAEQQAYEKSKSEIGNLMEQVGGKTAEGMSLAESSGLNEKVKQIATTNAEILAIKNANNQARANLRGAGLTQEQIAQQENAINTRDAFKITNLEMENAFRSINADALQKSINTQLALKYEPLETKLEIAKMNYQDNKDFFTKSEQRAYESKVREEERKIAKEKADDQNKFALLTKAMENSVQIPANLLSQINDPKTDSKKAASILAGAGISLENKLDKQYKQAQIAKMYQDIAESQNKIAPQNATPAQSGAQIKFLQDTTKSALQNVGASGRSALRRGIEEQYIGSTAYTQLVSDTNTIKTNMLTLATDPNIKKFFGPQMSNADVLLMTSAGTTLNPELQSPEKMRTELLRVQQLLDKMEKSLTWLS